MKIYKLVLITYPCKNVYLVRLDKNKNGYNYLCVDKKDSDNDEYNIGDVLYNLDDYYVKETDINILEIQSIFSILFNTISNDKNNDTINWLNIEIERVSKNIKDINTEKDMYVKMRLHNFRQSQIGELNAYKKTLKHLQK